MSEFYVEKKATEAGEHIVHNARCTSMPQTEDMHYLGSFYSAQAAVNLVSDRYTKVSTCPECVQTEQAAAKPAKAA